MPDEPIFFSYSRSDSEFVLKLAKDLRKAGADIWLDQLDIKPGSHWDSSIETALNKSTRLIIVLSPASVASNNVMDEVSFALETNKTVIPILIAECEVPFRLRRVQRVNFIGDYQEALNQLMEVLGYSEKTTSRKTQSDLSDATSAETNALELQKDKELETLAWENAKAKNTLDALLEYLQQYPHGTYQANALSAVKAIEEIEKQKAVGSSVSTSSTVKQAEKKPGSRKYVILVVTAIIIGLLFWKFISKNPEEPNDDNATVMNFQDSLNLADSFFNASQYASAWEIYQSLDTNNLNDTTALTHIGDLYYDKLNAIQDNERAKFWYEQAANNSSGYAMYVIGFLYSNGYGVEQNFDSANSWYNKACDAGNTDACDSLNAQPAEK